MLSSAALTYGSEVLTAALSLGNALIIARGLGAAGRGDVAFLTAVAYLTSNLATIGVQEAIGNIAGKSPGLRRALAGNALVLSALLGLIAIGAVAGLVWAFPAVGGGSDSILRWLALASIPMLILQVFLRYLVQADYRFGVANAALLVPAILNVGINGVMELTGQISVASAIVVWIGGQLLSTIVLGWYVARKLMGFGRPSAPLAKESVAFGAKSHVGRIMLLGNYRMDAWILGSIAGSKELGLYSVAVAWAEACFFLPTALAAVQRPDLVRSSQSDAGKIGAAVFRIAVVITAVLVIVLIVAAPFLCIVIFGEEFRGSVDDLQILALGAFGVIAMKQLASALTAQGFPIRSSVAIGVGFVVTLVLDIALIPDYGGLGAAIASTVAYTAGGLAAAVLFSRTLRTPLTQLVPRATDVTSFGRTMRSIVRKLRARTAGGS
jgi:O-antigen/teichoic acid export membrane protein